VRRALAPLGVDADIKWVNDLLVGGRKLCGILVESGMASGETFAVIGIGINLAHASFPEELAPIVTSVEDVTGAIPDRTALVERILAELRPLMDTADETVENAMGEYRRNCITVGKHVTVLPHGAEGYRAVALRVNTDGSLRVALPDGSERDIATGEVSVRMGEEQ
jgi:BirA family biotin operon repressor/biotin-[acetyl-CoA-carboxylase] ligase